MTCSTSAPASGRSAACWPPARRPPPSGRSTSTSGPRALTTENARRVGAADRLRAVAPDEVPADVTFAQIWSNPPIHIGKAELHELLRRWLPRLAPDGVAWLVVARHLGGDSLHRWLVDGGWQVSRHASQKGYRVLRVTR